MRLHRAIGGFLIGLLGLAGLAAVALTVRQHRQGQELQQVLVRSAEDQAWLAGLPRVDPAARDQAYAWMRAPWPTDSFGSLLADETWYLEGDAPPATLRGRHEAERAPMAELEAILASEGPVLSSVAWVDGERGARGRDAYADRAIPNLLHLRRAVRWYGVEAMLAADPGPTLDRVDRLLDALQPVTTGIEALILSALSASRDRMYLRAVYRGALSSARYTRWLRETSRATEWYRDAYRAERLLFWDPLARDVLLGGAHARLALYGESVDAGEELDWRVHARRDLARVISAYRLLEDYVRGHCDADALDVIEAWQREGGRTLSMALPSRSGMTWALLDALANHRLVRMLAITVRSDGPIPTSAEELPPDVVLERKDRFDVEVRYKRVAADRVRFFVPLDTPLPALIAGDQRKNRIDGPTRRAAGPLPVIGPLAGFALEARLPR